MNEVDRWAMCCRRGCWVVRLRLMCVSMCCNSLPTKVMVSLSRCTPNGKVLGYAVDAEAREKGAEGLSDCRKPSMV